MEVIENLFSNALEHNLSLDPPKRFIKIVLTSDGTTHSFAIENPANNITVPLEMLYRAGITTKSEGHQGLGLSSIHQILSSHGIQFSGRRDYIKDSIVFSFTYSGGQNL